MHVPVSVLIWRRKCQVADDSNVGAAVLAKQSSEFIVCLTKNRLHVAENTSKGFSQIFHRVLGVFSYWLLLAALALERPWGRVRKSPCARAATDCAGLRSCKYTTLLESDKAKANNLSSNSKPYCIGSRKPYNLVLSTSRATVYLQTIHMQY